jgi:hypothetical protein
VCLFGFPADLSSSADAVDRAASSECGGSELCSE